jgi:DNA mismatch repair ATPase MutS
MEALGSLGGFCQNNPNFTFPSINSEHPFYFKALGHPLIRETIRVNNDLSFAQQRYIILTGSNMSGKSTFLRSIGVNIVLAGTGAPVCATAANIHPIPLWVSMRLMDSLADSQSYFFAEIKRLEQIIQALKHGPALVLLDEILRGTNSDDKRSGTIAMIQKMVELKAVGAIATHDLEVCQITEQQPDILANYCFEVEIKDNDLTFDYQLRPGICRNKSATFLMEKMGIIQPQLAGTSDASFSA